MNTSALSIVDGLLDLIYPPKCLVCQAFGESYLCPKCIAQIEPVPDPYCPRCGHVIYGPQCKKCSERVRSFTKARAAGQYEGVLRQAIHEFKYKGSRMLAQPLALVLHRYLDKNSDFRWRKADILVPVPIHHTRKRTRGYNQSELLADELSKIVGIPMVHDALIRKFQTRPQVELSADERKTNVRDAFHVQHPSDISGKTILLIDDVGTTSSTIHECSLALLRARALRVYVLCLAFGD